MDTNKLPYQELLEKIANTPESINLYDQITSKFKTWQGLYRIYGKVFV